MQKNLLFVAVLILMVVAIYNMFAPPPGRADEYVPLGAVMGQIKVSPSSVRSLVITGEDWRGQWADGTRFRTTGPRPDGELLRQLSGVQYEVRGQSHDSWWTLLMGSWLPMLSWVILFYLLMRRLNSKALQSRIVELEREIERLKKG